MPTDYSRNDLYIVYFAQSAAKTETQYTKHKNRHTDKRKKEILKT